MSHTLIGLRVIPKGSDDTIVEIPVDAWAELVVVVLRHPGVCIHIANEPSRYELRFRTSVRRYDDKRLAMGRLVPVIEECEPIIARIVEQYTRPRPPVNEM